MPDIRGVLFDFGNTLFAHASLAETIESACADLGESRSTPWAEQLAALVEASAHTTAELQHQRDLDMDVWHARWHVLYSLADDEIPGLGAAIYEAMHDPLKWRPYARSVETLARIRSLGVAIAIVSNTGWDIRTVFVAHEMDHLVTEFVLSYEVGVVKPAPGIFHAACGALNLSTEHCLMVGDDARADSGAVAAGLRVLLVPALAVGRDNGVDAAARIVEGV